MDAAELEERVFAAATRMEGLAAELTCDVLRWLVAKVDELAPHVAYVDYIPTWETSGVLVQGLYEADGSAAAHTDGLDDLHDSLVGDEVLDHLDRAPLEVIERFSVRTGTCDPVRLDVAKIRSELCS